MQTIEQLCAMLEEAIGIIREQAQLLEMHGITTNDGSIENARESFLSRAEREGWTP